MKFFYAKELKQEFDVSGHFYNLKLSGSVFKCRNILEIRKKNFKSTNTIPEIIVIMMNPGSSKPLDNKYIPKTYIGKISSENFSKEVIPTRPDNAQYQIMRLMKYNNWSFVRVLNLSDLRNGNSGRFQTEFKKAEMLKKNNSLCITHIDRKKEFKSLIRSKENKIIAAWGSLNELKKSAESILNLKTSYDIIGLRIENSPNFKYASPYLKTQKENWLKEIQKQLSAFKKR